jgi:sialate O-acetylesterase
VNKNSVIKTIFLAFLAVTLLTPPIHAQVSLPKLISDGMVLQRDTDLTIWGWSAVNEEIRITFNGDTYLTEANDAGEWKVDLPPMAAGGPYTMLLEASNTITIHDILIGDVWICSGQSNMELQMRRVRPLYERDIQEAYYPYIRFFYVPQRYNFQAPDSDLVAGSWQRTDPETIAEFSAVAYFFARELFDTHHIPIGLIHNALGGSPAEAWLSEDALKIFPEHYHEAKRFKDPGLIEKIEREDNERIQAWYDQSRDEDRGYADPGRPWSDPSLDVSDWPVMNIPGFWADSELGPVNGIVWFRRDIALPADAVRMPAQVELGAIVDADSVFVNGVWVGTTGYQYPPRRYQIPEGVLREGENTIVVRVINERGRGGFVSDKPYELSVGDLKIDLTGPWRYRLGAEMPPLGGRTFVRWKPLGLYNAMLAPLLQYPIRGVIWYQGESNAGRPVEYRYLFPALIQNWRSDWGQGDFPFLFVQLANYMEAKQDPSESNWARLREAQLLAARVPNTGMAVAIDIGEWNDIHPLNKKDVGVRLALAARKVAYDEDIVYSGPIYESMKVDGDSIIIAFKHSGSGLYAKGDAPLKEFSIAGVDRHFVWANAVIRDTTVVVWSDEVANPVAVRYAWADNPEGANLYNMEGLPASPFRTDSWPAD